MTTTPIAQPSAPRAEEFLAQTDPDEPDIVEPVAPLTPPDEMVFGGRLSAVRIAESLERIAAVVTDVYGRDKQPDDAPQDSVWSDPLGLSAQIEVLEASVGKRQQVIDDVLAACGKSRGQLALKIHSIVDQAFKVPDPEPEQPAPDAAVTLQPAQETPPPS